MSIERERFNAPISFICDAPKCNEYTDTHTTDFNSARAKMKARGWTTANINNEWRHFCPDHSTKSHEDNAKPRRIIGMDD